MADYCIFCETRRPFGGTNTIVLNGGEFWVEFCGICGENNVLRDETGTAYLVREVFTGVRGAARDPKDVVKAEFLALAEAEAAEAREAADMFDYECQRMLEEDSAIVGGVQASYWDDFVERAMNSGKRMTGRKIRPHHRPRYSVPNFIYTAPQ